MISVDGLEDCEQLLVRVGARFAGAAAGSHVNPIVEHLAALHPGFVSAERFKRPKTRMQGVSINDELGTIRGQQLKHIAVVFHQIGRHPQVLHKGRHIWLLTSVHRLLECVNAVV